MSRTTGRLILVTLVLGLLAWDGPSSRTPSARLLAQRRGAVGQDSPSPVTTVSSEAIRNAGAGPSVADMLKFTPNAVATGDVTGDGNQDMVQIDGHQMVFIRGFGDGTFASPLGINTIPLEMIEAVDIDVDGIDDVAAAGPDGVTLFTGGFGANGFAATQTLRTDAPVTGMAFGRLNGDAFPDIAVITGDGAGPQADALQTFNSGSAGFTPSLKYALSGPLDLDVGYTSYGSTPNAAGATDAIVVTTPGAIDFYRPSATGLDPFSRVGSISALPDVRYESTELGDFNGDGSDDVASIRQLVREFREDLNTYLATRSGYDGGHTFGEFTGALGGPLVGDFNDDGRDDVGVPRSGNTPGMDMFWGDSMYGLIPVAAIPFPENIVPKFSVGELVAGVPNDTIGFSTRSALGGSFIGAMFPGDKPAVHSFTSNRGTPAFRDWEDLDWSGFGGTASEFQDMFIEIEVRVIPPLMYKFGALPRERRWSDIVQAFFRGPVAVLQAAEAPAQVRAPQVYGRIVSLGASTGEAFELTVENGTDQIARLASDVLVVEPVRAPRVLPATRGARRVTSRANAYCLDFAKQTPAEGTEFRVAGRAAQERARPLSAILKSAATMTKRGLLHPDSDPRAYADAIKQWSLWTKRENWDIRKFGDAFVERTKKNVVGMKQAWTKDIETQVRGLVPNRWRDITAVLQAAR